MASPPRLLSCGPSPPQHPPRTPVEGRPTPKHPAVVCHSVPRSGSPSLPEATGTVIRLSDGHSHCRKATWPRPGLWLSRGPGDITFMARLWLPGWLGLPRGAHRASTPPSSPLMSTGSSMSPRGPTGSPAAGGRSVVGSVLWTHRLTSGGPVSPAAASTVHRDGVRPPWGSVDRQASGVGADTPL